MRVRLVLTLVAATLPCAVQAERLFLSSQGVSPNRVAIFADDIPMDMTAIGDDLFGPTLIKRIEVTMVFEAKDQPYWTNMDLDFKCPNPIHEKYMPKKKKGNEATEWVLPTADVVEFRMGRGETRFKTTVDSKILTPTDWQSSESYAMKRVYRVACNARAIDRAKRESTAADGKTIDMAVLRGKLAGIGLHDVEFIPPLFGSDALGKFTWDTLWPEVRMPAIDNGRRLTAAEQKAYDAKMGRIKDILDTNITAVQGNLEKTQARFDFATAAAKFRGDRKWSETEGLMARVWLAKTETDVVTAIGPPALVDAGGVRFLSYGQDYDSRYVTRNLVTGQAWMEGVYQSCNVRFVLIPDHEKVLRVADVVVTARSTDLDGSANEICSGLLDVPR